MGYRFEDCELHPLNRILLRGGVPQPMEPQVFDLLCLLVSNSGQVLGKDRIIETVWKNRVISDSALTSRIKAVRRVVGDDGKTQRIIRTVHRIGYRFCAAVHPLNGANDQKRGVNAESLLRDMQAENARLQQMIREFELTIEVMLKTVRQTGDCLPR